MNILEDSRILAEREIDYENHHVGFLEKTLKNLTSAVNQLRIARNMSVIGGIISTKSQFNADFSPSPHSKTYNKIQEKMNIIKRKRLKSPNMLKSRNIKNKSTKRFSPNKMKASRGIYSVYNSKPREFRKSNNSRNRQFCDLKSIKSLDMLKPGDYFDNKSISKYGENNSILTYNHHSRFAPRYNYKTTMNIREKKFALSPDMNIRTNEDINFPTNPNSQVRYIDVDFRKKGEKKSVPANMGNQGQKNEDLEIEIMDGRFDTDFKKNKKNESRDDQFKKESQNTEEYLLVNEGRESPEFALPDNMDENEKFTFEKGNEDNEESFPVNENLEERFQQRQIQLDQISAELEKFDTDEESDFDQNDYIDLNN